MELEPRTAAPSHATGTVVQVPLAAVSDDATFRVREEGDVALLAASIGRLGQLEPIELRLLPDAGPDGPRYQVVAGFRRLAALRLLVRERVLARVHDALPDEDAWAIALASALLVEPLDEGALAALQERLALTDHAPWAGELVEEALVRAPVAPELRERFYEFLGGAPAPEAGAAPADEDGATAGEAGDRAAGEEAIEVTPEELAQDLAARLWQLNQDLAVAYEAWNELPPEGRRVVARQARYVAELYPLIAEEDEDR